MRSFWHYFFVALLAILTVFLLVGVWPSIETFLGGLRDVSSGNPRDRTFGLLSFALVAMLILALVKILSSNRGD
jgi:hypothetical protein